MAGAMVALDAESVAVAAADLAGRDADLARLFADHGVPPLWHKGPGFASLVDIVLGQQVSLTSARAALERVRREAGDVTPASVVACGERRLRDAGITRQKSAFLVGLAQASLDGRLDLPRVASLPDAEAAAAMVAHPGIGRWTADIYLLMGLGRPDVWPSTDLALLVATRQLRGLEGNASVTEVAAVADAWRPYRSVAARMLWQAYLIDRGRPLDE
jgi:DNA-3-methyladenine glycosylase II